MNDHGISAEDKKFLAECEEEFKDRFTEKDKEFMKVFNKKPSAPPIIEKWWMSYYERRNDRRYNQRSSYQHHRNRDYQSGSQSSHGPMHSRYSHY